MTIKYFLSTLFVGLCIFSNAYGNPYEDQILGNWMSTTGKVTVQVFKEGSEFKAKVVWFDDSDNKAKPMGTRTDEHNPNQALRNRKIIGLEVLRNLKYNPNINRWEDGKIYDIEAGREWNSTATLTKGGMLLVKGFKNVEFLCKTMTFKKIGKSIRSVLSSKKA